MIEFIQESHTYLVNGVITPSVSTILGATIFKDKYSGISEAVLNNAAQFGTNVHDAIERKDPSKLTDKELEVYNKWLVVKDKHFIEELRQEQKVHYKGLYCGTYDLEALVMGDEALCDFKTTSALDTEYVSWQLSMYELATGKKFQKLYAIWLPKKGLAKVVEVPRKTEEQIMWLLDQFYKEEKEETLWN